MKNIHHVSGILLFLIICLTVSGCKTSDNQNDYECMNCDDSVADDEKYQPILMLNTGGHMGLIRRVIPMNDGRRVITAADDKSIRIWDIGSGVEKGKILGHIGEGVQGTVYAMALTPDESFLAAGGYIHYHRDNFYHVIRIFDIRTGKLERVIKAHRNTVNDLCISNDGRYLVSASADGTVKVWDITRNYEPVYTFQSGSEQSYAARIFKTGNEYRIAAVVSGSKVLLWSLDKKTVIREYSSKDDMAAMAISKTNIAVSVFKEKSILIFNTDLALLKTIKTGTLPAALSFSPDGNLLLAGTGSIPYNCEVYDTVKDFKVITSFSGHDNVAVAAAFINNTTAVTCGGKNFDICIWDAFTGTVTRKISGAGRMVWSVGVKGDEIAFGFSEKKQHETKEILEQKDLRTTGLVMIPVDMDRLNLEKKINLGNYEVKDAGDPDDFKSITNVWNGYYLDYAASGDDSTLVIYEMNGKEHARIARDSTNGFNHRVYGFTDDGIIISGGSVGTLTAYNIDGNEIASLTGHTGSILSIAVDGDRLVSGSNDQTVRVWNLKELKSGKQKIHPVVSIFVSADNEWVVWNNKGFYNASPAGDRFVGWHFNHGYDYSAGFYSASQFRRYLYRPDIIDRTLDLGSGQLAFDEFLAREPGLKNNNVAELVMRAPVDVRIESVNLRKDGYADINIRLGSNNTTPPERITIYINGAQLLTENQRVLKNCSPGELLTYQVRFTEKKNHIRVTVENQWVENSASTTIDMPDDVKTVSTKDSTLYVIAVGISKYPNFLEKDQLESPPIDAKSIAGRFKKLGGVLYKKVDVVILTDDNGVPVTSGMVEDALLKQTAKAGPHDTTIIFLAGHGVTDSGGNYHFLTADTMCDSAYGTQSFSREGTTLSWKRLHRVLDGTLGRRVLIVDTCQAGGVFSDTKTDISKLVKDVHDVNAIIYSGASRQDAGIETSKGGVFTLSLISGIDGKAKYEGNILPFVNLRDYVNVEVPSNNRKIMKRMIDRAVKVEDTYGKSLDAWHTQGPVAVVPDGMEDFIIYAK